MTKEAEHQAQQKARAEAKFKRRDGWLTEALPRPGVVVPFVETIVSIKEFQRAYDFNDPSSSYDYDYGSETGWIITTSQQHIILAMDDEQNCCESWGCQLVTEDDTTDFIGAKLIEISLTDTALKTAIGLPGDSEDCGTQTMFVNIVTDRGKLQFVAYNSHNGYYGHQVRVSSKQLTTQDIL